MRSPSQTKRSVWSPAAAKAVVAWADGADHCFHNHDETAAPDSPATRRNCRRFTGPNGARGFACIASPPHEWTTRLVACTRVGRAIQDAPVIAEPAKWRAPLHLFE